MKAPILTQYTQDENGVKYTLPHRAMGMDPSLPPKAMGMAPRQEENMYGIETNLPNTPMPDDIPIGMVERPKQMMQGPNPFDVPQYQNLNVPDMPVQYGGGMVETLLNDNEVPEKIRKDFWFVFHKDNTLGFLDETRKQNKLMAFDIAKIDALACIPYYDYNFEMEMKWGILRNVFDTKLDRALGHKGGNIKNERIMLQSQFSEQRQISENDAGGSIKEGFFKRLLGRR